MSQPRPPPPLCGRVDLSRGGQSFPTLLNSNPDAQASRSQCRGDAWKPQTQRPVLFRLREDGAPQNAEECVSGVGCLNPGSGTWWQSPGQLRREPMRCSTACSRCCWAQAVRVKEMPALLHTRGVSGMRAQFRALSEKTNGEKGKTCETLRGLYIRACPGV